jgi:opine dehydrogenase
VNITVMGSGNGGLAVAYHWASKTHRVNLYAVPGHDDNISAVAAAGGVRAHGDIEGFAPVAYSGTDVTRAMEDTETVFVVAPAFATADFARLAAPYLRAGMVVAVCPGSCVGSLVFKEAAGLDVHDESVIIGETNTLPYASRADGQGAVHFFHSFSSGLSAAAAPRSGNARLLEVIRLIYPYTAEAATVFQTTLQNGNPVIHPAVTLLNTGLIERTGGDFNFYEDGVTESVGRLMAGVDRERMAIADALGVQILSEPELGVAQGYMTEANYTTGYSAAPGFRGIKAPDRIATRYLTEDLAYTMVFWTDLAARLGVATPVMDALIQIASVVLGRDLIAKAPRTLASVQLDGLSTEQLLKL